METPSYECDCDKVIEMEEMRVGVEEILQYVRAVLLPSELDMLAHGLEAIRSRGLPAWDLVEEPEELGAQPVSR